MKKLFLKPGFEFIFSLGLIVILGLPPMLMAQNKIQKDLDINIQNGDTTINGKNIKNLSAADRQQALTDINNLQGNKAPRRFYFKRLDTTVGKINRFQFRMKNPNDGNQVLAENTVRDSVGNMVITKSGKGKPMTKRMTFDYRIKEDGDRDMRERGFGRPMNRADRRNSQNFSYESTDNNGVATHISFHVSEVSNDDLKKMPYVEGAKFDISDLNIVPEFSTGKTLLMFKLPAKTVAEVKLHDSEGKLLWSEKAVSGNFSKSFALGLNGVYYLQVKQGNNISMRKIFKEE